MNIDTVRLGGWSLVLVAVGIVVAALVVPGRGDGRSPVSWTAPEAAENASILDLGEEVALPDVPPDAWTIHSRIHGASDVAPAGDGWVVLDARGRQLHFLDEDLRLIRTVGGPGQGPGELGAPAAVAVSDEDVVGVVDLAGTSVDLFDMDGAFLDRVRPDPRPCPGSGIVRELLPHPEDGFVLDVDCTSMSGRDWVVARMSVEGGLSRLVVTPLGDPARAVLGGGRGVAFRGGRVWLVTPDGCMRAHRAHRGRADAGETEDPSATIRCLPPREPIAIPDTLREQLRTMVRAGDGRPELGVPSHFPTVLAVGWSPVGAVFSLPPDPESGALGILPDDGVLRRVRDVGRGHPGRDALLLVRTFMEGTGFHSVPWPVLFGPGGLASGPTVEAGPGSGASP